MADLPGGLAELIPAYLGRQRWYAGAGGPGPQGLRVEEARRLWAGPGGRRALWWAVVSADGARYQLLVGERAGGEPAEFLNGHEVAVLGMAGGSYFYDATLDGELALELLRVASGGAETAERVRPVSAEQSNTSLVYDDRLILKVFRRLAEGANPDVVVTTALAGAGFAHVAAPLVSWRANGIDLAFGQEFLAGGSEGWALALTSLRDLYNSATAYPAEAGGDFAAEAARLGRMTAEMHLALAGALGVASPEEARRGWVEMVGGFGARVAGAGVAGLARPLMDRLATIAGPGPALRVHGDYHLGQVMRTDSGWYVLDFEGEPARPLAERAMPSSPLKDVTGMLRSLHYAARFALREHLVADLRHLEAKARAWESHNRQAFLDGYTAVGGVAALLPDPAVRPAVLMAYELDKVLYELAYERAYRPDWVPIPLGAVVDLLAGGPPPSDG